MQDVTLKLESIGDDHREKLHHWRNGRLRMSPSNVAMCKSLRGRKPFVKLVTGVNHAGIPTKKEIPGRKSYLDAKGTGGRGVYYWYTLRQGECYQIQEQVSWKKARRYFCIVNNGTLFEISQEQAVQYILSSRAA